MGHEKSHFAVVLSCFSNGINLKPMVVFKQKTKPISNFPNEVFVHVHQKDWMDGNQLNLWIKKCLGEASRTRKRTRMSVCLGHV